MTELTTASAAAQEPQNPTVPVTQVAEPAMQVLITEQQVLLATAAAAPRAHRGAHRTGSLVRAMAAVFERPAGLPRRHRPARYEYLERSAMAREMWRL